MKPAPFAYAAPETVDEAVGLLGELGDDAAVLAGGQSLVPAMNVRLARPSALVDINRVRGTVPLRIDADQIVVGLRARHAAVANIDAGATGALLAAAGRHIGHLPIRLRGTFCGSLAHADPAAEWCAVAVALDGVVVLRGREGERVVPVADFVDGPLSTTRRADELLVEARLPRLGPPWRSGFSEHSRRAGDFATALAAAAVEVGHDGTVLDARIAVGGVEGRPRRLPQAEAALCSEPAGTAIARAGEAATDAVEGFSDVHAPAAYRRHLAGVAVRRALEMALSTDADRAQEHADG